MKKKHILGLSLITLSLGSLILTGCDKKVQEENANLNTAPSIEKETPKLKIVNPNTKSRPYAIMINNADGGRPYQSGLQDAYLVYEIIVEGGLTRYMALFLDQNTERIGTVRSARHYFLDYALENDAIYIHHGKSPQAQADFKTLNNLDRIEINTTTSGWRDTSMTTASGKKVSIEHTLYTNIERLNKASASKRTTRNNDLLLNYSIEELDLSTKEGAKEANNINIKYSGSTRSSYEYDAENKVYKRSVNGKAHIDYVTKSQYTFKNIITYQVKNTSLNDNKGRQDLSNIGRGEGWYISNGYAVPITWEKETRNSQTIYKYKDGTELVVNDGNTFIQIQPTSQTLTIE